MTASLGCVNYRETVFARAGNSTTSHDLGAIWIDDGVGALLRVLEDAGRLNNTLFLFQLDHGIEAKMTNWENGNRVAQFAYFPREFGTAGRRLATPVSTIDVTPTLLDFAGVDAGAVHDMDGKTWRRLAVPQEGDDSDESLGGRCIFSEMDTGRALVCDRCHKLIHFNGGRTRSRGAALGYAVDNDLVYFNLCAEDGNYVDYPAASKESDNMAWAKWDIFTALQDVMNCFMEKTSPQKQPGFDVDIECSFADSLDQVRGQTGPPDMIPTNTPTSAPTPAGAKALKGSEGPNKLQGAD